MQVSEWVSWGICNGRVQRRHSWWSESAEASVTFNETDWKTQAVLAEMMGLEAADPPCSQISWSCHEQHGRRTGSRGTSCVSVLIKTLTEGFSVSLSACLLPYFVFLPLTAVVSGCGDWIIWIIFLEWGLCALATVLGAAVVPDPGTTLLWCLCWEVRSGSSGSGSRLSLINLFFKAD